MILGASLAVCPRLRPSKSVTILVIARGIQDILTETIIHRPAAWACFETLGAAGPGSLSVSLLPTLQAAPEERHAATSAGMYSFACVSAAIWGVTKFVSSASCLQQRRINALSSDPTLQWPLPRTLPWPHALLTVRPTSSLRKLFSTS
ncbi:hypothetical protein PV04_06075 [Phialophora macrospora]|uniref:Uncharacterized protein n=1 Tax=Phialophora macrospora TaxID=1851006 RepID=A0A0D2FJ14_9EURO|nr:hypothetical protein PV04_06075 [Phialophora macrospora]